ncbi:MAG: hypothetical protein JXB05_02055 [Myxococcaceae bacterium]|nr:hypothetical protein [Myxococcaceae bacterium]
MRAPASLWRLVALLAAVLVGGCVDVHEELWVESGGGRLQVRLTPASPVSEIARQFTGQELVRALREEAARTEASLKAEGNLTRFAFREDTTGGAPAYVYELEVRDITRLHEVLPKAFAPQAGASGMREAERFVQSGELRVERLDNGNYRFTQRLGAAPGAAQAPSGGSLGDRLGAMIGGAIADRFMQGGGLLVRVHGAEVLSGNGTLSPDKRSVEWRVSAGELLAAGQVPRVLEAELQGPPPLYVWAAIFGVGLAALGLAVRVASRRRR